MPLPNVPAAILADAVALAISEGNYSPHSVSASRSYVPTHEISDGDRAIVLVAPRTLTITPADRRSDWFAVSIDVGVMKRPVVPTDTEQIDALMQLVQQVIDTLRYASLSDVPDTQWVSVANDPVWAVEHLKERNQFTSLVTVTYRMRVATPTE